MSALLQPLSLALAISIYAPCSDPRSYITPIMVEVSNIRLCSTLLKVVTSCDYVPNYIVPSNSHFMNPTKTKNRSYRGCIGDILQSLGHERCENWQLYDYIYSEEMVDILLNKENRPSIETICAVTNCNVYGWKSHYEPYCEDCCPHSMNGCYASLRPKIAVFC